MLPQKKSTFATLIPTQSLSKEDNICRSKCGKLILNEIRANKAMKAALIARLSNLMIESQVFVLI